MKSAGPAVTMPEGNAVTALLEAGAERRTEGGNHDNGSQLQRASCEPLDSPRDLRDRRRATVSLWSRSFVLKRGAAYSFQSGQAVSDVSSAAGTHEPIQTRPLKGYPVSPGRKMLVTP